MVEDKNHQRSDLAISSPLLGSVQHLQGGLGQGLGLIQEGHLLLVVVQLGRHAHCCPDQWVKVAGQLANLRSKLTSVVCGV